jgi:hypothetical protein
MKRDNSGYQQQRDDDEEIAIELYQNKNIPNNNQIKEDSHEIHSTPIYTSLWRTLQSCCDCWGSKRPYNSEFTRLQMNDASAQVVR